MSPFVLDKNVPLIGPPKGGQIGADGDEQAGVGKGGSAVTGRKRGAACGRCRAANAGELPASEATVEALSRGRRHRAAAPQRGAAFESRSREEVSAEGARAGPGEVRRCSGRAVWADAGRGAFGGRGWFASGRRDAAPLDAGGGFMEPGAETAAPSTAAGPQGTFWRDGADGWEFSRLAGGAWAGGMSDRHGR